MKEERPSHVECQLVGVTSTALLAIYFLLNSLCCIFAGNTGVGSNVSESQHDGDVSIRSIKMDISLPSSLNDFCLDGVHVPPNFQSGLNRSLSHLGIQGALSCDLGENRSYQRSYGSAGKSGNYDGKDKFHMFIFAVVIGGIAGGLGCPLGVWIARFLLANAQDQGHSPAKENL